VQFDGQDPVTTTAVAATPRGDRCVATAHDPDLAKHAMHEELIGREIAVAGTTFTI
jgi:hypothetical protein